MAHIEKRPGKANVIKLMEEVSCVTIMWRRGLFSCKKQKST